MSHFDCPGYTIPLIAVEEINDMVDQRMYFFHGHVFFSNKEKSTAGISIVLNGTQAVGFGGKYNCLACVITEWIWEFVSPVGKYPQTNTEAHGKEFDMY